MVHKLFTGRLILSLALLASLAALPSIAKGDDEKEVKPASRPTYTGPKKRIAVMPMTAEGKTDDLFGQWANIYKSQNRAYTSEDVGRKLTEMLTTALFDTGRFVILERQNIGDVRDEIAIGAELGNEKTAVKKGSVLGAQILVRAAVTEFENTSSGKMGGISIKGIRVGGKQGKSKVVIDVRMYDSSSSQILYNAKADGDSTSQGGAIALSIGSLGVGAGAEKNDPIERATRNAIEKAVIFIVEKMEVVPWEGRVATVKEDGMIYVNRGTDDGLRVGDKLIVYKAGEAIIDPETDAVIGREEDVRLGTTSVSWVDKRLCRIDALEGKKIGKNDVVKLASQ